MNFHDLIVKRRSIRRYTAEPIAAESVKLILEAGLLAPTSKSSRAWRFVAVEDKETLERLSTCKASAARPISGCSLAIVVAVDSVKDDAWIEDASVAASYIQLQAADLGLGSCWIQVRGRFAADGTPAEEVVADTLGIPEGNNVVCIISIGHPDEERKPQNTEKLLWENVHIGRWQENES